jgi:anhydro-N-acetylmuramic acid kinase
LIERLKHYYKGIIEIPSDEIIQFKEAIIFAYLGYLRLNEKTNTLNSVTNASRDSIGGCIYKGNKK